MALPARILETSSPEKYLAQEKDSLHKNEYFAGEIFMMADGSTNHNRIALNISGRLNFGLEDKRCETFNSDQRLFIKKNGLFTYPDAMVVCGRIEFDKKDSEAITNPIVIIEILSLSTQDYDRGSKFELYRDINSFREYLLIHQDKVYIEHYHKDDANRRKLTEIKDIEKNLIFHTINFSLPVRQIYARVDWLIK